MEKRILDDQTTTVINQILVQFKGERLQEGTKVEIVVDGVPRPLPYHLAVQMHSPMGFDWGYGGSGPAQLALAMCVELIGPDEALKVYQGVKEALIAPLQGNKWNISGSAVIEVIEDAN